MLVAQDGGKMSRVRNSEIAALIEWLCLTFATIIKMVRDGVRTTLDLDDLKIAMQAVIDDYRYRFKIWKTIRIGVHKNADEYREAIKDAGGKIGDWANDIMSTAFTVVDQQPTFLTLVLVTVAELGYEKGATLADICKRAIGLGLELCPAEVGPALRLQYMDQPNDEWMIIGMEPIAASRSHLEVFYVDRDGDGLWLDASHSYPDYLWSGYHRFVFVRRK